MKKLLTSILTMTTLIGSLSASAVTGNVKNLIGGTVKVTEDFTIEANTALKAFKYGGPRGRQILNHHTDCGVILKNEFYGDQTFLAQEKSYLIESVEVTMITTGRGPLYTAKIKLQNTNYISHIECKRIMNEISAEGVQSAFGDYLEVNYPEQHFDGSL